jgi:UDP-N-acetyl-D-mannosaminuronic acid dehydrogenase
LKFNKICVLGMGYIGLPTASTFATNGIKVHGVDVNPQIVKGLQNSHVHIHEPGLRTLVKAAINSGNLTISQEPQPADAFIISVPTPFQDDKTADMSYVTAATKSIIPHLRHGNLVILESTSPPRTTVDLVAPILEKSGLKAGQDFHLAYSPERVLPGQILRELIENARVIGGINTISAKVGRDLYASFVRGEIILTDTTTAEMVKLMENTYRDINIAVANEFSRLAERFHIDAWEAISIANRHPRVNILNPGPGVGGHCISVDPWFLVEAAPDITPLIRTSRQINDAQPQVVVEHLKQAVGGSLDGKRVAALGLAYKADVDDLRSSPAVEIAQLIGQNNALVKCYEPYKVDAEIAGLTLTKNLEDAIEDADVIILLAAHEPFRKLQPEHLLQATPARLVFDAVHAWDATKWTTAGFNYHALGVGS